MSGGWQGVGGGLTHTPMGSLMGGSSVSHVKLKESLHLVLMTIVFFEINQLHSLGYR